VVGGGRLPLVQRHPQQPSHEVPAGKRRFAVVSLFLEPTNRANGLTRDLQGRLAACEHDSRRVTRQEADGSITVVANSFQGRRLNRPNDVVVRSDGCIYFTDPWTSPAAHGSKISHAMASGSPAFSRKESQVRNRLAAGGRRIR
jgi:sugar lactone lactonase YvrE